MAPSNDPEEILQNNYDDGGSVLNNKQVRDKVECVVEVNIDRDLVEKVCDQRDVYLYKGNLDLNKHQHSIYTNPREEYPSSRKTSKAGATVNRVNRWNFGSSEEKPNIENRDTVENYHRILFAYQEEYPSSIQTPEVGATVNWANMRYFGSSVVKPNIDYWDTVENYHRILFAYQEEYPSSIQTPEVGATVNWANRRNLRSSVEKPNSDWFLLCLVYMYCYYYGHECPPLISMYLTLEFLFFCFSCIPCIKLPIILDFIIMIFRKNKKYIFFMIFFSLSFFLLSLIIR